MRFANKLSSKLSNKLPNKFVTTFSALLLGLVCGGPAFAQIPLTLDTAKGQLQGVAVADDLRVYRGIPYAAPPVGENRWRAPQPLEGWDGVRDASAFASRCMQRGDAADMSEDCLYLNVWSAAPNQDALQPVILWLHGGGFSSGAGSNPGYDGAALARQGAVVVTINYRLGPFGFFAHPALTAEAGAQSSGNYALLDMIAALEWVYDNIAAFGGDPINVSIVGESAGAQAVAALLASPRAAGLFHRAVAQSGGWMGLGINRLPTLSEREARGSADAEAAGATTLEQLRALPAQSVLENFGGGGIITDGYVLARDPSLIYAAGQQQPVDILAGSNANEATFFGGSPSTVQALRDYAANQYGALAEEFLTLYPANSDADAQAAYQRAFTDALAWQMRQLALYQGQRGLGAYAYYFTRVPPGQEARGASHTAELPYMFNQSAQHPEWLDGDRALANTMSNYWVRFAASTNPNSRGLPTWPAYRTSTAQAQTLDFNIEPQAESIPSAQVLEFFDKAYAQLLSELEAAQ
ncbi:MAG: carboxylesterase family protein [Pseudomonadales bacterium]|jgi:para-nitrobenzyl esterase|nr:carboxylesterase family protein [Pseudomonadales bacterium]